MNFPHQNALLRTACERHRALRIAGWVLVYGAAIGCVWMHCYLHPLGGQ